MSNDEFYIFSEYMRKENRSLTASLEDYLEMIYRLSLESGYIRINELADTLNVQPSSVTKAVQKLSELNLINYEKYGIITLNEKGNGIGQSLLSRHNTVVEFLRIVGVAEDKLLEETEKIEHTISSQTAQKFEAFVEFFKSRGDLLDLYRACQNSQKIGGSKP